MLHIKLKKCQVIELEGKNTTISKVLNEAIEFCQDNNCEAILTFQGFTFDIDKNSDIIEKVKEYRTWEQKNGNISKT